MARIKKTLVILILLITILPGCSDTVVQFPMHQSTENIIKIELLKDIAPISEPIEFSVLYEIPEESFGEFIDLFSNMPCRKGFLDCPTEFGVLAIRITYINGDIEMIGHGNNAYFTDDQDYYGTYYFSYDDFRELFSHYVDETLLPELG